MAIEKPTAAESAQWHREQAAHERGAADRATIHREIRAELAAHHESAAEALELLAEIAAATRATGCVNIKPDSLQRLLALVEGR